MKFLGGSQRFRAVAVSCIALFIALFLWLLPSRAGVPEHEIFWDDAATYHETAVHVATEGFYSVDGVTPYANREPMYSVFLGGIYRIFGIGNRTAIFAVQALLYLFSVVLFIRSLRPRMTDTVRGLCLFFLLTVPPVLHAIFFVYRESFLLSILLLFTASILNFQESQTWGKGALLGTLLGTLILTSISFLFLPLFLLPLFFVHRLQWRYAILILGIPYVCVLLWGVRNFVSDGTFRVIDPLRPSMMWYARGEQAEQVRGLEPLRCLWSEYVSRDWSGRSSACSFNGLIHGKWPDAVLLGNEREVAHAGQKKILENFFNYLWFSAVEVIELHLPYVNGWGRIYNILALIDTAILYLGCLFALPIILRQKVFLLFVLIALYNIAVYALTDAIPRYQVPVIFCYALFAAVGYAAALRFIRR